MLKLQFLLAWRNIVRRKFYSAIEVLGLAVGLACFFLILIHFRKEMSYDTFFRNPEKIYRILNREEGTGYRYSGGASGIGFHAGREVSGIEEVVRIFYPYRMHSTSALVTRGDTRFFEDNIIEADSGFFDLFDFEFLAGDRETALSDPNAVVLSEKAATKYFGTSEPLGKFLEIQGVALLVSGVVNVPGNTHLDFDFVRPAHSDPSQLYVWDQTLAFTYVKIRSRDEIATIERQLYDIILKNSVNQDAQYLRSYFPELQPLTDIHTTILQWDIVKARSKAQLWGILVIAFFILILAIVNFINLSTALSADRIKETGLNKILGASQHRLTVQFFVEYASVALFAGILSIAILGVFTPLFNSAMSANLVLSESLDVFMVLLFFLVLFFTALMSGWYPAYRIAAFKPTDVVKRKMRSGYGQQVRQALVVFQFAISMVLLSGTLIVRHQITFLTTADLGISEENVFVIRLREGNMDRFQQLSNTLQTSSAVLKVAGASALIGGEPGSDTFHPDHMQEQTPESFAKNFAIDANFLDLFGVQLVAGRNFMADNASDHRHAYIINEATVKRFQLADPVGANFRRSGDTEGKVIGVMSDFYFAKMTQRIEPMVFYTDTLNSFRYMFIKIQGDLVSGKTEIDEAWAAVVPDYPMEGFFQDQYIHSLYNEEEQIRRISEWFCILALFLACLGLLGMSSFVILQRRKEIGIRKVVGASVPDILIILVKDFFKPIAIAYFMSIPITIYLMDSWLTGFTERITIGPSFFIISGFITFSISLMTISVLSIKTALANPVNALKEE